MIGTETSAATLAMVSPRRLPNTPAEQQFLLAKPSEPMISRHSTTGISLPLKLYFLDIEYI